MLDVFLITINLDFQKDFVNPTFGFSLNRRGADLDIRVFFRLNFMLPVFCAGRRLCG